jgi:hypothetical protein
MYGGFAYAVFFCRVPYSCFIFDYVVSERLRARFYISFQTVTPSLLFSLIKYMCGFEYICFRRLGFIGAGLLQTGAVRTPRQFFALQQPF